MLAPKEFCSWYLLIFSRKESISNTSPTPCVLEMLQSPSVTPCLSDPPPVRTTSRTWSRIEFVFPSHLYSFSENGVSDHQLTQVRNVMLHFISYSWNSKKPVRLIFFFKILIWPSQVLVAAGSSILVAAFKNFSCDMQTLSFSMWDLVPWLRVEPRPPALGVWSLSHWTSKEVPSGTFLVPSSFMLQ